MNLRDLRYIVAVADHGHFGRAASACAVSQPTLSGQILKLEKELGVDLFERVGKSVRLTVAGVPVLDHARRAVTAADDVLAAAALHRDPRAAPLRLGIIPTLAPYLMPIVLPVVRDLMPNLHLTLLEDLTSRLVDPVAQGDLDAALIASDPDQAGLRDDVLFDEPFWLVLPATHSLAAQSTVAPADVDVTSLLLLRDGHCLRDQALALCARKDIGGGSLADMARHEPRHIAPHGRCRIRADADAAPRGGPRSAVAEESGGASPRRSPPRRAVCGMISRPGSARRATIDRLAEVVRDCVTLAMQSDHMQKP